MSDFNELHPQFVQVDQVGNQVFTPIHKETTSPDDHNFTSGYNYTPYIGSAKLIWITPNAEQIICEIARVSNPKNQFNDDYAGLIRYCMREGHWSILQMANMCLGIEVPFAISVQMLRHWSMYFHELDIQQFSTRYADVNELEMDFYNPTIREQDHKNRQNSLDTFGENDKLRYHVKLRKHYEECLSLYNEMIDDGVAKEIARFVLPESRMTRFYINSNIRNWVHYLQLRSGNGTQLEHMYIANKILDIFTVELPIISEASGFIEVLE